MVVPGIEEVGHGAQVGARAGDRARLTGALFGADPCAQHARHINTHPTNILIRGALPRR
jgi:hypothetical protein